MTNLSNFKPEWLSPPGCTVADILEERELSIDWLASILKSSDEFTSELLAGKHRITDDIAEILSEFIGSTPHFWKSRDEFYIECLKDRARIMDSMDSCIPHRKMSEYGWIDAALDKDARIESLLRFFDSPNVVRWDKDYGASSSTYTFRTSKSFDSDPIAIASWLRRAEIEAELLPAQNWAPALFKSSLQEIRALTRQKDPIVFIPALKSICARSGVACVVIPPLPGCRASGASKLLKTGKALIAMSARHLSDDHFWFTFFHEAAHLLLHNGCSEFVDHDNQARSEDSMEKEANSFAQDILIPERHLEEMIRLPHTYNHVIKFAAKIGTSHGIVVGQMQYLKIVRPNWLNQAKRRYRWQGTELVRA